MKKIIGIIVIILLIPVVIMIISDIDRTPVYPTIEFDIIDKPSDKQILSNDKLLYQLPNTIDITINELPLYVEYYENGSLEVDSGILNYTINDNLAYINYIDSELTQVVDGELIFSKPTQIISKSNNLFKNEFLDIENYEFISPYYYFEINVKPNTDYTIKLKDSFDLNTLPLPETGNRVLRINNEKTMSTNTIVNIISTGDRIKNTISIKSNEFGKLYLVNYMFLENYSDLVIDAFQLNEGTEALPYQPYAEHIYPLDNGINLYKLPNGVGDRWLQDGTLEQNVGIIDTVDNYAEYGTLPIGTYDNILEFINNNQNKQIKIFFDDNIQESRYNIYLENDTIIINNDIEVIRIYNDDTYTSTLNLDTNITYKLEGYHIIEYIDGKFDNTVLAFFWIIPVLLAGGLFYLLLKRKE